MVMPLDGNEPRCEASCVAVVERLVTIADVDDKVLDPWNVSVKARHEVVLTDGRRLLLLDDRGL